MRYFWYHVRFRMEPVVLLRANVKFTTRRKGRKGVHICCDVWGYHSCNIYYYSYL